MDLSVATLDGFKGKLDTIIMNPPFGTKNNKGVDMVLLKKAIDVKNFLLLHEFLILTFFGFRLQAHLFIRYTKPLLER